MWMAERLSGASDQEVSEYAHENISSEAKLLEALTRPQGNNMSLPTYIFLAE